MKKCPACDKTFADGMKFCQTDGTLLIADVPPVDPYKTVIGSHSDIASASPPLDPFKTMVASPPKAAEEDLLQLPDEHDALKTMVVSQNELREELKTGGAEDVPPLDLSPSPSAPLIEPKPAAPNDFSASPKFDEPSLSPPIFGDFGQNPGLPNHSETSSSDATVTMDSSVSQENPPSPFDSKPFQNDFSTQSPYGNQENKPIPSPFQDSLPPSYQPPSASPFDAAQPPFKESEPMFGGQQESPNQSAFQPPPPFGQPESFNQPMMQSGWTPPPAPVSEWQNQNIGQNTPFQPPVSSGQDQTLAIVSLVCGILSIFCCGIFTGIPALITGYMAKNNVDANPNQYGGRTLALAGMVTGGIGTVLFVIGIILQVLLGIFR